jgi:hypothetical protein
LNKKPLIRKYLAIGIILIFIGICVIPLAMSKAEERATETQDVVYASFFRNDIRDVLGYDRKQFMGTENLVFQDNSSPSSRDEPSWLWTQSAGGTYLDEGTGIAVDNNGDTYIAGLFVGTVTFGNITLASQGNFDVFIAKLDSNGDWLWAVSAGGTDYEWEWDIALDANGNIYVIGHFKGTAQFGNTTLTTQGDSDVFVAKLNTDGDWLWAVSAGGTNEDCAVRIAVDTVQNVYITGYFWGTATFGYTTLISHGYADVFVAKLNTDGDWLWAVSAGGTGQPEGFNDEAYGVAVDVHGNVYITGYFWRTATFGNTTLTTQGDADVFVAKLNTDGDWQWVAHAGGPTPCAAVGIDIAVDTTGNSYITGYFLGIAVMFDNYTITNHGVDDFYDVFVAKLDNNGDWQWAVSAGGTNDDMGVNVAVDTEGDAYVTGYFSDTAIFGNTTLTSYEYLGMADMFVTKINSNGEWQWVISEGGPEGCAGSMSITVDTDENVYITGCFIGIVTFNDTTLISHGDRDVFVAKLAAFENQPPSPPTITGPVKGKIRVATNYNFTAVDPNDNKVYYFIDWGDTTNSSWIGPYSSGELITQSHTWSKKGGYLVKAKAKDIYGRESDWAQLDVTMPFSYNIPFMQFWMKLFEQFPNAFPILRYLLGG